MLAFGEFELNEARFELRRGGRVVRVEPRVLELLIYLARHADRVVTKEELLREVWHGRFVSETALTHAIAEARKVLGGGDPHASYIRTIHGRGYRLALPSGALAAAGAAGTGSAGTGTGATAGEVPVPAADASPAPAISPASSADPGAMAGAVAPGDPNSGPRLEAARRRLALVGLTALALTAALLWRARGDRQPAASPAPSEEVSLAIVPIAAPPGETELQLTALSLGDLLTHRLSGLPGVLVRAPGLAAGASLQSGSLDELARGIGAELVLSGSIERSSQTGNGRVELQLLDLRPGAADRRWIPWRYDLPLLERSEDLALFRRTTEAIAQRVADELRVDLDPAATPSAPRDLKAYRLFLLAFGQQAEVSCMGSGAAELLRDSLELDSGYAPAWQAYASAEYNRAWACGEAREHYETALEALARAEQLSPTRLDAMLRASILAETGRVEEGYAVLAEAGGRWPDDAALDFQRAQLLHYAGFLDEARRRFEASLAADPLFAAEGWIPRTPFYRGEFDRFLELLPAIESPIFRFYRASAELARGRSEEARRLLEPVFRMNPGDLFARLSQAQLALLEGNSREAEVILDHLALQRAELGGSDGEVTYKIAQLYARAGRLEKALPQLELTVDQGFFCAPCLRNEPVFGELRGEPRFQRLLLAADRRHREFGRRFELVENE